MKAHRRAVFLTLAPLWLVFAGQSLWPQQPLAIHVGPVVQVSQQRSEDAHGDVWIAADPTDPKRLVATSTIFPRSSNRVGTVAYTSLDGGNNWSQSFEEKSLDRSDDPVVAFGPDGTPFVAVTGEESLNERYLAVSRSADHGKTWIPPTLIPDSFEALHRQFLVVDASTGKYRGRVYLTATGVTHSLDEEKDAGALTLLHSSDNAATFPHIITRPVQSPRRFAGHLTSVVLSDGTLVSLFGELLTDEDAPLLPGHTNALLRMVTSHDGGESFSLASTVSDWAMDLTGTASHAPMLAVDPGSKYFHDRLYAVWPDRRSGRGQILLAVSEDNAQSWSAPHIVNDDAPFPLPQPGPDDFMPAIAVNSAGVLGVVWCDRRDNRDDNGWSMRFAASFNGGRTFTPSAKIPRAGNVYGRGDMWTLISKTTGAGSNSAAPDGLLDVSVGVHPFYSVGGDYIGMTADSSDVFHPVWADNHTGVPQVWTTAIQVAGEGVPHGSLNIVHMRDISAQATLEVKQLSFDRTKNLVTMSAQMKNTSPQPITGPLKLLLFSVGSELGRVEVVGADNGETHAGAIWDFTDTLTANTLAPGEISRPKLLYFHISDLRPIREGQDVRFGIVNFEAQVLAH